MQRVAPAARGIDDPVAAGWPARPGGKRREPLHVVTLDGKPDAAAAEQQE